MAALPYMRMYWADYDADTAHLTAMQHGIYLLLIKNYWQRGGPLPDDELRLSRIAKVNLKEWRRNEDVIREFFSVDENLWHHSRIAQELALVEAKSLKAKKSALANAKRTQSKRLPNAERTPTYTEAETDIVPLGKPNAASGDSDKQFWDSAKAYIGPKKASLIGKWVSEHGKAETAAAITAAQVDRAVDPVQFIQGRFRKQRQEVAAWDGMA
jgi:uncharacterized protein YdaU (DUF1376 family)